MNLDLLEVFQHRMDAAAAEQVWAAAILGTLNAFVITKATDLGRALTEVLGDSGNQGGHSARVRVHL